ncbi:hypothetical protein AC578_2210 [Pseudocercospora eumusae]|uniref:Heterokaryon incompatibility domain-containing protein n=1 Tax=Pseudocercospora eumusae TaxID=321146 RepID=A0A139HAV5_9PEZI|nr:hypothetical protein AC578_2210 [Pseudocercospora eumusae]
MPEFRHEPFTDPSRQTRLLQIPLTRWGGGMHLQLSTWGLEEAEAPPYRAISSTWGPAGIPTRSVTTNGQNMEVHQKCRFALLQARTRCPGEYVMDRLNNLYHSRRSEREERAQQVLACVGESSRRHAVVANIVGHMRMKHDLFQGPGLDTRGTWRSHDIAIDIHPAGVRQTRYASAQA